MSCKDRLAMHPLQGKPPIALLWLSAARDNVRVFPEEMVYSLVMVDVPS
jgi:hypothetical protein